MEFKLKIFHADGRAGDEESIPNLPTFTDNRGIQALKEVVVAQAANSRQGNASTKTRAEVSGGGKKPWRQKGTGRARHGSSRSPIWSGGGVVFGPKPRDYRKKINRKVKSLAFQRAFYDRCADGSLHLLERLEIATVRTRELNGLIDKISPEGTILLVDRSFADPAILSGRNIARLEMLEAAFLSTTDLCLYDTILITRDGLEALRPRLES